MLSASFARFDLFLTTTRLFYWPTVLSPVVWISETHFSMAFQTLLLDDCSSFRTHLLGSFSLRLKNVTIISPLLHKLHWLPIEQRIIYKTAVITFKVLHSRQPAYLADLITPQRSTRDLRSNSQNLLVPLRTKLTTTRRSFAFSAPHIWNSLLSPELRACRTLSSFRHLLKTHLYPYHPP